MFKTKLTKFLKFSLNSSSVIILNLNSLLQSKYIGRLIITHCFNLLPQ